MAPTNELLSSDPTGLFAANPAPGLTFVPPDYQLNMAAGMTPENLLYKPHPLMSVPLGTPPHSFCPPPVQNKIRSVPMSDSCVLKLKGLPYSTTEQEIYDFFSGYEIRKVAFVLESDGRPSGLAFAEFDSTEEALRAMQKNGEYIGDRYVKLLHVPKQEMEDQVKFGTAAIPKTPKPRSIMGLPTAALYGLPGFAAPQTYLPQMGLNPTLNRSLSTPAAPAFHLAPGGMPWSMPPSALPAMSLPSNLSLRPHSFVSSPFAHIRHFTNDGSTVRVRGLPFRVTEQEIREFFSTFNFIPTSVQIDKDTTGRSSGEGWITFVSPDEARRAVRERNRQYLQNRYLELSVLQIN